jgi:hypothetical protein
MPIFISYNREDTSFVDSLVRNLVRARHIVWMDRWELGVGDSLTQRIQSALKGSDAILVVLSKHSVASEWCKRELTAGLVRELEEKKTLVMPCVIDDCEIPLFLRDKLYADFRRDPDEAFGLLDRSLSRISNAHQGRFEDPDFFTDFSIDWGNKESEGPLFRFMFIDHGKELPYVIWSMCDIFVDDDDKKHFFDDLKGHKDREYVRDLLRLLVDEFKSTPLTVKISDHFEKWSNRVIDANGRLIALRFNYRRMGTDTGMDVLVHLDVNIGRALDHYEQILRKV